ncbi:MAG: fibronectin type III domain-containing protein [Candidatus Eisenbacteria bacterium]
MATANSIVRAGDVVRVRPGIYTTAPDPAVSGTPTARITYVGNLAIPDAALVSTTMTLKRKYITVKGMSFSTSVYFDRLSSSPGQCAQFDSLAYANVYHSLGMNQAKDCMAYMVNVTSGLGRFTMTTPATPVADWTTPERDTIRRCTFHLGEQVTDGYHIVQFRGVTNCVIDSNQVNIQMAPNLVNEIDPFIAFYMRNSEFKDNRWRVKHSGGNHLFRWRDSTMFNRVHRDSIILFGSGNLRFAPSSAGSYVGTTTQNYFNGLYVKCSTNPSDYALYYQNGMRRDTLINCVVIDSLGKAFTNGQVEKGTSLIDHCTFVGNSKWGVAETVAGVNQWGAQWATDGRLVFTNNLIYQLNAGGAGSESGKSWVFSSSSDQLVSNGNLYFLPGISPSRAIVWSVNGTNPSYVAPGPGSSWANTYGRDVNSFWGSPRFLDSTFTNFDPRPGTGSFAIGRALDGTAIGARQPSGPDGTPPSSISNLNATEIYDNKIWLTWSSPGDDGAVGVAQIYDLRYSASPINATNFAAASAVSPQPTPLPSGSAQSYLVPGLSPGVTYYFAIRTRDDAGNWSAISNVRQAMTTSADLRAPAAVQDLMATP